MTKLYEIRIETDERYFTYGYCKTFVEAEMNVNCWRRWMKRVNELIDVQQKLRSKEAGDEFERLGDLRMELWDRIIACCPIENTREWLDGPDEWNLDSIRIVEIPIGIVWPENPGIEVGK